MQWSISEMLNARAFKPLPLLSAPLKPIGSDYWSSRNKKKPLSKVKHVLRKFCGVSEKWWRLEFSNLCSCVQHPWKLTNGDYWSSRDKRKPLFQQKCVWRKFYGVSQKWWMLDLANLCHCVQHPWKFTSRDYWRSRSKRMPHSKQNVFWENTVWYLRNGEYWSLQSCATGVSTPEKLLVGVNGALGTKESHFLS